MITKKTWEQFKDSGLLWWINSMLHTFGWAIVCNIEDGKITDVYPARVKFRGFDGKTNSEGYKRVSKYMMDNSHELSKECDS